MAAICFAWCKGVTGKWGCKGLTSECNGQDEHCPFYKTREQQDFDKEEALKRIASLPAWQRRAIADQYYRGETPWGKYVASEEGSDHEINEMKGTAAYESDASEHIVKTGKTSGALDDVWQQVIASLQCEVAGNA